MGVPNPYGGQHRANPWLALGWIGLIAGVAWVVIQRL